MWKCGIYNSFVLIIICYYLQRSLFKANRSTYVHIKKMVQQIDKNLPIVGDGGGICDLMPQEGGLAVLGTVDMGLDSSCAMVLDDDMGGVVDLRDSSEFLLLLLLLLLLTAIRGNGRGGSRVARLFSS